MVPKLEIAPQKPDPEKIPTERPHLGQWFIVYGTARKRRHPVEGDDTGLDHHVTWEHSPIKSTPAMYIGYRRVYSGLYYITFDGDQAFSRKETHEVWLFVVNSRTNPIYVFPDQIEIWESDWQSYSYRPY